MDFQLTGKVALVTGGSRGLGSATAGALVAEGCHVAICARGRERLDEAAAALRQRAAGGARVETIAADVSTAGAADTLVRATLDALGGLDIVVNNVGLGRGAGLEDTTDEVWQEAFDQTLYPAIRVSRAAVPHQTPRRRDHRRGVVDLRARSGRTDDIQRGEGCGNQPDEVTGARAREGQHPRRVGRAGLDPFSRRILACATAGGSGGDCRFVRRELPFGRFGKPEEVGDVVAFLASPRASWISGTTVVVDGCQSRMF